MLCLLKIDLEIIMTMIIYTCIFQSFDRRIKKNLATIMARYKRGHITRIPIYGYLESCTKVQVRLKSLFFCFKGPRWPSGSCRLGWNPTQASHVVWESLSVCLPNIGRFLRALRFPPPSRTDCCDISEKILSDWVMEYHYYTPPSFVMCTETHLRFWN